MPVRKFKCEKHNIVLTDNPEEKRREVSGLVLGKSGQCRLLTLRELKEGKLGDCRIKRVK